MTRSYVVTGGGRGVGRAIVARLLSEGGSVVVIELDSAALRWTETDAAGSHLVGVVGSAADEDVAEQAATRAEALGTLTGWVNNAAVFQDAALDSAPAHEVLALILRNLAPAVVGCATAVRRFLAAGSGGAIVNVSSHQAQRAVRGALPYATAKAATEGLTRAVAVDYGAAGIRANAVALGSVRTSGIRRTSTSRAPRRPPAPSSRWPGSTRSAASAAATRLPPPSPTCSPRRPASSRAPSFPSTGAGQRGALTPRRPEPGAARPRAAATTGKDAATLTEVLSPGPRTSVR